MPLHERTSQRPAAAEPAAALTTTLSVALPATQTQWQQGRSHQLQTITGRLLACRVTGQSSGKNPSSTSSQSSTDMSKCSVVMRFCSSDDAWPSDCETCCSALFAPSRPLDNLPCPVGAKSALVLAKLEREATEEVGVEPAVVDSLCHNSSFSKLPTLPALLWFISHLEAVL